MFDIIPTEQSLNSSKKEENSFHITINIQQFASAEFDLSLENASCRITMHNACHH